MNKKTVGSKNAADKLVKNIRRKTARRYSAEEKIRIVLAGLRGEEIMPIWLCGLWVFQRPTVKCANPVRLT